MSKKLKNSPDSGEMEDSVGDMIYVDIEGFTAAEDDSVGIQNLIEELFVGIVDNYADFIDLIISQNYVGCVLKQVIDENTGVDSDEEDNTENFPLGLNTVVSFSTKKKQFAEVMKSVRTNLLSRCEESSVAEDVKKLFREVLTEPGCQRVGLLINKRLSNLPVDVALPAFQSLISDVEAAKALKMPFDFDRFVIVSQKCTFETLKSKKKIKRAKAKGNSSSETISNDFTEMYYLPEDEIFAKLSEASFDYSVSEQSAPKRKWCSTEPVSGEQSRQVLLIPAQALPTFIKMAQEELIDAK